MNALPKLTAAPESSRYKKDAVMRDSQATGSSEMRKERETKETNRMNNKNKRERTRRATETKEASRAQELVKVASARVGTGGGDGGMNASPRKRRSEIKIFHSPHPDAPTQKEGVAVVLNRKIINADDARMAVVVPGRAIQLSLPWRGSETRHLLCIYAPTSAGVAERRAFYQEVREYYRMRPNSPKPDLMAGDFNNVEDALDRSPATEDAVDASVEDLDDLKTALGLMMIDGWRAVHPETRDFTFQRGTGEARTMSRLDRIYVTRDLARWAREWKIEPVGVRTDHNMVSVMLTAPTDPEVGKGRPVFPLHLLRDRRLAAKMKAKGIEALKKLEDIARDGRTQALNPQTVLCELKKDWMLMARQREKETVPKLMKEIELLEERLAEVTNNQGTGEIERTEDAMMLTDQIRKLKEKRHKQQQASARAKHRVDGERPTKYWTRIHRKQAPRELIPAFERDGVLTPQGEKVYESNPARMAEIAMKHHDNIQKDGEDVTPPAARERDIRTALGSITSKIDESQAALMGAPVAWEDVELSLRFAKAGTAPGLDGIQYEVWKTAHARFVEDSRHTERTKLDVVKLLTAAYEDVRIHGVCESTKLAEGWMSPIYKEKGERTKVVNYRPITLLNTDYKILSKVLAIRLAEVAPEIVHPAQAGFVPGRRLRNHTQLAKMMITWAEAREVNGAIIALDQEKAYDKIAHDYLWRVLEAFGIPEAFTSIVKSLYASAKTSVVINGVTSDTYEIYRGVRQGDPLSCLLFDLAIEPLSAMIRNSPLEGLSIPTSGEALKATLFADDTTVYLSEGDDFQILQNILDTWCSAAKARFNIGKTEIIPLGSKNHRRMVINEYERTGKWQNYPTNAHVAKDGEAVRILGAFMGNGVDQCEVWTPKIEKVQAVLERWKMGHATVVGKAQAVQMMLGGMTQFMTDVQRMPTLVVKRLNKLIRNYVWDDKPHVPIATDHLYLTTGEGGIGLLDLEARNEAIDLMWLKEYLRYGNDRPDWAKIADDLLAITVPKDVHLKEEQLRISTFLQHWKPAARKLMPDLKAMIQVAKKYGVQQEAIAFSRSALRAMPMWDHNQTERRAMGRLSAKSATTTCLKRNHELRTVGDFEKLAKALKNATHKPTMRCVCTDCEAQVTTSRCANPHRCYVRAKQILDLLPPKWDPRREQPEDYENDDNSWVESLGVEAAVVDRRVTTEGQLGETFRVFTDGRPLSKAPPNIKLQRMSEFRTIGTDGSCTRNGEANARAGAGVYVAAGSLDNIAMRLPRNMLQSNQTAEMTATLLATTKLDNRRPLLHETDSKTVIRALTADRKKHEDEGYILQKNSGLTKTALAALRARTTATALRWVKGHSGLELNEGADKLAAQGAGMDQQPELEYLIPHELWLSGAKMSALTQRLAYKAIRQRKSLATKQRTSTSKNLAVIKADISEKFAREATDEAIWLSLTKESISKECRQFLWRTIHDSFMVGRHWQRPNMSDELQARATCKVCGELESMEHILMECRAAGRETIWQLLKVLWESAGYEWTPLTIGTILGVACTPFTTGNGERKSWQEKLWMTLCSESAYLVWKLRCERVIQNDGMQFTTPEVKQRWYATINRRLNLERKVASAFPRG
ncbi:Transposon TX1 uncharacterized 149 kDa protein [Trametes pubescens]|uniref:Transposon TX1 uncharacterized 149 kDa protein n=1 Tax=Trametes pubescens TaxID=154538 RepID=A0A1M2VMY5_TRAPU|nr:Transposon TX1 uncharacterized 149 kDa protein [Trametes pubescens]